MTSDEEKDFLSNAKVHSHEEDGEVACFVVIEADLVDSGEKFDLLLDRVEMVFEKKLGHKQTNMVRENGKITVYPDTKALSA